MLVSSLFIRRVIQVKQVGKGMVSTPLSLSLSLSLSGVLTMKDISDSWESKKWDEGVKIRVYLLSALLILR
jgi:hypothetical protein